MVRRGLIGAAVLLAAKVAVACGEPTWIPRILEDSANTVCHVWFDGSQIRDTKGCSWLMTGSVSQVSVETVYPPGAGPFSYSPQSHYEIAGTLNFSTDQVFSVAAVYRVNRTTSSQFMIDNVGPVTNGGWSIRTNGDQIAFQSYNGTSYSVAYAIYGQPYNGQYNVFFAGKSETQLLISTSGILSSWATVYAGMSTHQTRLGAQAGVLSGQDYPFLGTLYEMRVDAVAPSAASFTAESVAVYRALGKKIVSFLGDSNTVNYSNVCPSKWNTTAHMQNDGVSGDSSIRIAARLPDVIARGTTDVVIMAGTNDRGGVKETTWANLLSMYTSATNSGVRVWPLTIPPCGGNATCDPWEASRIWINDNIKAWGVANSRPVIDMDLEWGNMASPVGFSTTCESGDHVHATLACQLSLCNTLGGIIP